MINSLDYTKYLLRTHNNDVPFVKKVVDNAAQLAKEGGDTDSFELNTKMSSHLDNISNKKIF